MSNLVEIRYEKVSKYPEVLINGETISRYMSLSDYIYDDIFRWADKFFEIIDGELAESYRVIIAGHPYHEIVLRAASAKSDYCEKITFEEGRPRISIEDKYEYVCRLKAAYGGKESESNDCIVFHCEEIEKFNEMGLENVQFTEGESAYCIASSVDAMGNTRCKYRVVLSDKNYVEKMRNATYLYVTQDDLPTLIEYLLVYHVRLADIEEVFAKYGNRITDAADQLEFEAYNKEEYRVYMTDEIPAQVESGEKYAVNYKVFPACFPASGITLKTDNKNILTYENGCLVAKNPGKCTVSISDAKGTTYFTQTVECTKHNYATNISVVLPSTYINIGESLHFRSIVTPTDAEDINEVTYTVSDEKVAVMSGPDELYALSAGRICLTVATARVKSKVYITILPKAYDIAVSSQQVTVPFAAEATIYGTVVPANVNPMPALQWSIENKKVARIKECDSEKCVIESHGVGKTILVCKIEDTEIRKEIEIEVPKTKGCYVATSVYGSYDCPEVWVLRRYRDEHLAKSGAGRTFIKLYYAVSPKIVERFGQKQWFNKFWKKRLDKMVTKLQKKGYEDTPYMDD